MFAFRLTRQGESCEKSRPQGSELLVFSMNEEVLLVEVLCRTFAEKVFQNCRF